MPAMLDDPTAPIKYRTSGEAPYPTAQSPMPLEIIARQFTLRDRVTTATLVPFSSPTQVPASLVSYLCDQLNKEIEKGDTYPMTDTMTADAFGPYWFGNFGAVMLLGDFQQVDDMLQTGGTGADWTKECLGSFYIKPNYPGRSSHVCNGGFLVTDAARNRGVGRLMGEGYLEWAPKIGYTYSVFNLVYETNVASCRIWDALGFKRIGRVKECGNLRSYPDRLVDAIIYGRDLGPEGEDYVSEERFDKIRYYLKHGKYPNGADRAEKSRLRSAATHYRLMPGDDPSHDRLMLKDKEVISDPQRQYEIAKSVHSEHHGGINKTTAMIAEKFHWVRIKETVSLVIRNCADCKELSKTPAVRNDDARMDITPGSQNSGNAQGNVSAAGRLLSLVGQDMTEDSPALSLDPSQDKTMSMSPRGQHAVDTLSPQHDHVALAASGLHAYPYDGSFPVDPQLMHSVNGAFANYDPVGDPFWSTGSDHGISADSQMLAGHGGVSGDHVGLSEGRGAVSAQAAAQGTLSGADVAQLSALKQEWNSSTEMDGAPRGSLS